MIAGILHGQHVFEGNWGLLELGFYGGKGWNEKLDQSLITK